jgi:ATP-dependent Clp protease ATP-binding subunit ClpC
VYEWFIAGAAVGALAAAWYVERRHRQAAQNVESAYDAPDQPVGHASQVAAATDPGSMLPSELAQGVAHVIDSAVHPHDVLANADFEAAVASLASSGTSDDELIGYATGPYLALSYLSVEALARRPATPELQPALLRALSDRYGWRSYFALRTLHAHAARPVVGSVVMHLDPSWQFEPERSWLREFIGLRQAAGEEPEIGSALQYYEAMNAERREELDGIIAALRDVLPAGFLAQLESWKSVRIDYATLERIGHLFDDGDEEAAAAIIEHEALRTAVSTLRAAVTAETPRTAVVIGEPGVGKSAIIARLSLSLRDEGWTVFRCSAGELLAGQIYIGQIEERIATLVRSLEHRTVLWVMPEFHELLHAGRTIQSPQSLLDNLYPFIERGTLRLLGETTPAAYEKVLQQRPRLRSAVEVVRVDPLDANESRALTGEWARSVNVAPALLDEAHQLAAQHLAEQHEPGSVFTLLRRARELARDRGADAVMERDDLLHTLASMTGLPLEILDDREPLEIDGVRRFFTSRVLGQDEAVEALVERLALIKAGLTDPSRPQGVFLFAGPTGTGKTELAKALAEYLFGSTDRMTRLDMSEFAEPGMAHRMLGSADDPSAAGSLVDAVRRQPFCVVLFDELEKAEPRIWDLFLQLFDDGRLTDNAGNTASFRNAIVIMTSNLGAGVRSGGIGFTQDDGGGVSTGLQQALERTFRPELINRIDRIVQFRPLPRNLMRRLLDKEIREVLARRGLRDRPWALEWEESAIELLISHGFSPALGARPLKRAVERYLLAPLAMSIVGRQLPQGDQFLYITTDGSRLRVEFIDPDAAEPEQPATVRQEDEQAPALEDIVRDARGDAAEADALAAEYEHVRDTLAGAEWQARKQQAFDAMAAPAFWSSADRFGTLGLAESMDRIEVGVETAGSLLQRVRRAQHDRGNLPPRLVQRLAQQLYLVGEAIDGIAAGQPRDAFVRIVAAHDPGVDVDDADEFARRIAAMYAAWAEQRGMRLERLEETTSPLAITLAVSGFAAYRILAGEHGQHVLETPMQAHARAFARLRALVLVAPQPDEPASPPRSTLQAQAARAFDGIDAQRLEAVRRYRDEPSPLVRDLVRGWRTGRLDLVLAGDFDVIG